MKTYIGILGSCATGKSTRLNMFIEYLDDIAGIPYQVHDYVFEKNGAEIVIKNAGRAYANGVYIVGNKTKSGNWVGADYTFGKLGDKQSIYNFLEEATAIHDTFIVEGYFAVGGGFLRPDALSFMFDKVNQYYFLYDTLNQYVERTENRTGKTWVDRGKDPSKSAGWKSNQSFLTGMKKAIAGCRHNDKIVKVDYTKNKYYFVDEFKDLV
tara:strand:- start:3926 stop:4555 length:630 start_codon:yes stop_codon:yes gene_type:complete